MAEVSQQITNWKQIASINVLDGRQYEQASQFNKPAQYKINPIGNYIGIHSNFVTIPKQNQLPKLIPNIGSLINEDLNKGFKQTEHIITKTTSFTSVLNESFTKYDINKSGIQFVTFRNNINKIMAAPYFHSKPEYDAFAIDIIKKDNIIYFEIVDRKCILNDNQSNNEINKTNDIIGPEWWGRRFENICRKFATENICENKQENDCETISDENKELIILIESNLNEHKLLMAAEIDCVNNKMEYVEIKTQKYIVPKYNRNNNNNYRNKYSKHQNIEIKRNNNNIRYHPYKQYQYNDNKYNNNNKQFNNTPIVPWYKCMKIWIQSFLGGVNNVLIGFRNEKGIVVNINTFNINYFQNKINYYDKKRREKISKGNVCLNFTDNVLQFIKNNCKSQNCVYRVVFNHPWTQLILYSKQMN